MTVLFPSETAKIFTADKHTADNTHNRRCEFSQFWFPVRSLESSLCKGSQPDLWCVMTIFCLVLAEVIMKNLLTHTVSREGHGETVGLSDYVIYFQSVWSLTQRAEERTKKNSCWDRAKNSRLRSPTDLFVSLNKRGGSSSCTCWGLAIGCETLSPSSSSADWHDVWTAASCRDRGVSPTCCHGCCHGYVAPVCTAATCWVLKLN